MTPSKRDSEAELPDMPDAFGTDADGSPVGQPEEPEPANVIIPDGEMPPLGTINEPTDQPSAEGTDTAPGDDAATEAPIEPVDAGTWEPRVVDAPPEEPEEDAEEDASPLFPPGGRYSATYRGWADQAELRGYTWRKDETVVVPSDVAEELATWPTEAFDIEGPLPDEE